MSQAEATQPQALTRQDFLSEVRNALFDDRSTHPRSLDEACLILNIGWKIGVLSTCEEEDRKLSEFFTLLENTKASACHFREEPPYSARFIVIEGLDGSGKSTLAKMLAEKLDAQQVNTPSTELADVRICFDRAKSPYSRAFYLVSNFILSEVCQQECLSKKRNIVYVCDRFYTSTVAYNMCNKEIGQGLPFYPTWPQSLLRPEITLVLQVPLKVRASRIQARNAKNGEAPHNDWDKILSGDAQMADRILGHMQGVCTANNLKCSVLHVEADSIDEVTAKALSVWNQHTVNLLQTVGLGQESWESTNPLERLIAKAEFKGMAVRHGSSPMSVRRNHAPFFMAIAYVAGDGPPVLKNVGVIDISPVSGISFCVAAGVIKPGCLISGCIYLGPYPYETQFRFEGHAIRTARRVPSSLQSMMLKCLSDENTHVTDCFVLRPYLCRELIGGPSSPLGGLHLEYRRQNLQATFDVGKAQKSECWQIQKLPLFRGPQPDRFTFAGLSPPQAPVLIVLGGGHNSGKSTIGKVLRSRGLPFYDGIGSARTTANAGFTPDSCFSTHGECCDTEILRQETDRDKVITSAQTFSGGSFVFVESWHIQNMARAAVRRQVPAGAFNVPNSSAALESEVADLLQKTLEAVLEAQKHYYRILFVNLEISHGTWLRRQASCKSETVERVSEPEKQETEAFGWDGNLPQYCSSFIQFLNNQDRQSDDTHLILYTKLNNDQDDEADAATSLILNLAEQIAWNV